MKATELRIGNYHYYHIVDKFNDPQEWDEVCQIDYEDLRILSERVTNEEYKPIPLTEEWLLKFGFKIKTIGAMIHVYELNDFAVVSNLDNMFEYKGKALCFAEYVHQLQNLYFALTLPNQELTIK